MDEGQNGCFIVYTGRMPNRTQFVNFVLAIPKDQNPYVIVKDYLVTLIVPSVPKWYSLLLGLNLSLLALAILQSSFILYVLITTRQLTLISATPLGLWKVDTISSTAILSWIYSFCISSVITKNLNYLNWVFLTGHLSLMLVYMPILLVSLRDLKQKAKVITKNLAISSHLSHDEWDKACLLIKSAKAALTFRSWAIFLEQISWWPSIIWSRVGLRYGEAFVSNPNTFWIAKLVTLTFPVASLNFNLFILAVFTKDNFLNPTTIMPLYKADQLNQGIHGHIAGMPDAGASIQTIAMFLGIPPTTIHDTVRRFQEQGHLENLPIDG
ncbi:hypothetical protein O181_035996 [Austropuccinia psidii MF-1]|uniref:Uncharacterized protein n=1 Tax=Austropuccinia psidii MF-1 TaxID=1389203 RepID=A0A9Q3D9C4_9BASI|nr:hypothetical protein [Austropuccinia psidii MF-1]